MGSKTGLNHSNWLGPFETAVTILISNIRIFDSPEYRTQWVSGIQMVKSRELMDHLNTGYFGPFTGLFLVGHRGRNVNMTDSR